MSRFGLLVRQHGIDVLIVLAAVVSAFEVALSQRPRKGADHHALVRRPGRRADRAAAARTPADAVRRSRRRLAAGRVAVVHRRATGAVHVQRLARRDGRRPAAGPPPRPRQARLGLAIVVGGAAIIVYNSPDHSAGEFIFTPALFVIAWLAGFALRERAEQAEAAEVRAALAERERDAASRIAVAEERARIARELHDIVAHAVSVMVLQVGAVQAPAPRGARARPRGAPDVEQAGRTALTEMRRLLGAMRRDGDAVELAPQPGLDRVPSLLDEVRRAGLPVDLHIEGEPSLLPPAIDLSAYRIVQEGLTNALKHAARRARGRDGPLRARRGADHGADDGAGASSGNDPGYGLAGMHERVKIYGGEMSAGSANGGGFVLRTASRSAAAGHDPRPRRRRPVDGPRRLPDAPLRRAGHRGGRGGRRTASRPSARRPASTRPSC